MKRGFREEGFQIVGLDNREGPQKPGGGVEG